VTTTNALSLVSEPLSLQRPRGGCSHFLTGVGPLLAPHSYIPSDLGGWPWSHPAQGKASQKQALSARIWDQAISLFLKTQPGAFRPGECGGEERGRRKQALKWMQGLPTDS